MKDNDNENDNERREGREGRVHKQIQQPDQKALARALPKATHVSKNENFDPSQDCENRPGGADLREKLEQRWNELILSTCTTGKINTAATDGWFQTIYEKHTETGRHYHTAVHLWEMFELLDIVVACNSDCPSLKWYVPMAWSVLFHDAIYDARSNRNEKDSAELFREFVHADGAIEMEQGIFDVVLEMIVATETHQVTPNKEAGADDAEIIAMKKHFLDIDMAVLGKHETAYMKYAAMIRREYEFVPRDLYCSKRAEILETFLGSSGNTGTETKSMFLTEAFRKAFEDRARLNLRQEIDLLRNNTIPT